MRALAAAAALWCCCSAAHAQGISQRGFVEGRGVLFPQEAVHDPTATVADLLVREEVFVTPTRWLQFAGGVDLRANSHDQVDDEWRLDLDDRSILRPRASLRRLTATLTGGGFSLEVGKQFVRWARTDVLNPIDRFAPRDYLTPIDSAFLPIIAARPALTAGNETLEVVWTAQLTPSRMPLLDQRWTVLPPEAAGVAIVDEGSRFPRRPQYGARWRHTGSALELGASYFDGFNHLPHIDVRPLGADAVALTRVFPRLRVYAADLAVPTGWFTLKGEAAFFTSPRDEFADYSLFVIELERQAGEWLLTAGYAGEVLTASGRPLAFDPERGLARSIVGRAAYTVDPRRTVTVEGAVRQEGEGLYLKGEYSQALGQYLRLTLAGVTIAGDADDFIGQYERNSHAALGLRVSF